MSARAAIASVGVLVCVLSMAGESAAIPAWSRKYDSECQLCHTAWPQLNRTGLEFRRRGYRFPGEMTAPPAAPTATPGGRGEAPAPPAAYGRLACAACHRLGTTGSTAGPALDDVGARLSRDAIKQAILSPSHPGAPDTRASDAEIDEIAAFLAGQKSATHRRGHDVGSALFRAADYLSGGLRTGVRDAKQTGSSNHAEFHFDEAALFYGGALGRRLSPYVAVQIAEGSDVRARAQLQITAGSPSRFFYVRAGQMHAIVGEGIGPLDRGKGLSVDQVVSAPVNGFRLDQDQRGVEAAYVLGGTAVRAFVLNGVNASGDGVPAGIQDANNAKDVMIAGEHLFGGRAVNSVTALYYRGSTPFLGGQRVKFSRAGVFGSFAANTAANVERVRFGAGFLYGRDDVPARTPGAKSWGMLASVDARVAASTYATVRFDRFRPTDRSVNNVTSGAALGMVNESAGWLRVGAEYQLFKRPGHVNDHRIAGELLLEF